ncbi:M48 family metallopeptidase [Qipengyuania marisflavi]|uniref:PDZ domain-containing protein n=1 Tax=Qipengyuania marisflavi TaxID=2486356 RepID=A0A5S3P9G7_9SPHN|nr:M48 family metallopeptidase [Qipengyuania marisflavi]TMM50162.1 hypothetical protein FEV51_02950 [Qipengyuania marisflavi]
MPFRIKNLLFALLSVAAVTGATLVSAHEPHWAVTLRGQLVRVAEIDWRLATVAPQRCARIAAGFGLALDSISAYPEAERPAVAAALNMTDLLQIAAVAKGSPGELAGLEAGDNLAAINGAAIASLYDPAVDIPRADQIEALLTRLPIAKPAQISVQRGGDAIDLAITPLPRCAARSILAVSDKVDAYSDQSNLALTTGMVEFAQNDDELALIAGHELAHIMLLDRHDRLQIRRKRKEDEADRLGAELAVCAGYDLAQASKFWLRYDSTRLLGFLPTFTHRNSKVRYRALTKLAAAGPPDCADIAIKPAA